MFDFSFLFRPLWIRVPITIYFFLLFSGLIFLIISTGIQLSRTLRYRRRIKFDRWIMILLLSITVVFLTMTGRIAPDIAFGG